MPPEAWPAFYPRSIVRPGCALPDNLRHSAQRYPHRPAINFYGRRIRYAEFDRLVDVFASYLSAECRLKGGEVVALCAQNSPQFAIAFFAILRAGGVVMTVNPMSRHLEWDHQVSDANAIAAVVGPESIGELRPFLDEQRFRKIILIQYEDMVGDELDVELPRGAATAPTDHPAVVKWAEIDWSAGPVPLPPVAPDDLACLLYTSGSTGKPKACMHTHATAGAAAIGAARWTLLGPESVCLATAPFFHVTGLTFSLNAPVFAASEIVPHPRWDAKIAALMIERFACSHWSNVPTMVIDLLAEAGAASRNLSSLKCLYGGGAAIPEAVAAQARERIGVDYLQGYGMTEFMSQTHMNPPHMAKPASIGVPYFDTLSKVVDPETLSELPAGETGEIIVSNPQMMVGYLNQPEQTARTIVEIDGRRWLRTGDIGRVDEDGYFYVSDRLKRMINCAGYKVWPSELESVFYEHPGLGEACIVGAPDKRRGQSVKLYAVKRAGHDNLTAAEVIEWAKGHMAAYKVPRTVEFLSSLPRTPSGKIMWRALQDRESRQG